MKKNLSLALLLAAVCSGCAVRYTITLTNGEVVTARGKPKLDAQRGYYIYKAADGQTNIVFAGNVREVAPSSMVDKSGPNFLK